MKHPELTQCLYSLYSSWELSTTLILIQGLSRLRLCGWWEMRLQWKGNKTWDKLREKARDHRFHNLPWNWPQEVSPSREPHTKDRALVPTLETYSSALPWQVLPWLVRHLGILRIKLFGTKMFAGWYSLPQSGQRSEGRIREAGESGHC